MKDERTSRDQTERAGMRRPAGVSGGAGDGAAGAGSRYVRPQIRDQAPSLLGAADDPAFAAKYPALHEYLTLLWVDGKARQASTLLICADEGMWKGCLSDRDADMVLWGTGAGFLQVLETLEGQLASGQARWREKRPYKR